MTPERWRRLEALYHAAQARPAAARSAYLAEACGEDAALREEVLSLLAQPGSDLIAASFTSAGATSGAPSLGGRRLGVYDVQDRIGAGGMGEVYRARDTRLRRDVAIKVLPPAFTADGDRLARFEREARVLAALNHPHIAAIYGVEEADEIRALVLELVEGETLAERLARGPLSVAEARSVADQIANALETAHERGIVHRDLKPANIKVTPGGTVKVLDFGLAKVADDRRSELAMPTLSTMAAVTGPGVVMGTAAYMSPEQARGLAVDKRTDNWAFGCVLYELLTGQPVFARATLSDTLAAVVHVEPDWRALPQNVPASLVRLLKRCLQKDPAKRLRDIGDARLELEDVDAPVAAPSARRTSVGGLAVAVSITAAVIATAVALWLAVREPLPGAQRAVRFAVTLQPDEQVQYEAGLPRPFAISSDGRTVAYVTQRSSGNRMYLRRQDDVDAQPLVGTEGATGPFFSPNGQWIGFAAGGALKKVSIAGGAPQMITAVDTLFDANWSDGGSIVFHEWASGLFTVPADGGTPQVLTTIDAQGGERMHVAPHVLPGGRAVLFAVVRSGHPPSVDVVELSSARRKLLTEGADPHYLSSGHLVFTRGGRLYVAPFDLTTLALTAPPAPMLEDIAVQVVQDRGAFAVARDGTVAYLPGATTVSRLVAVTASGSVRTLSSDLRRFVHPRLAPDGRRLVVSVVTEAGGEMWVYDLDRTTGVRTSVTDASRPIWSHDGKRITFQKDGSLYSIPADDSAAPELVLARGEDANALFPLAWSRDGNTLVYSRPAPGTNRDVFTWSSSGKPRPFVATLRDERSAMLSPDSRWMVYAALETGREEEVYVEPYPGPGERTVVSEGGGREPLWSPRGDAIFYRSADGQRMMAASVRTEPTLKIERPITLFQGSFRTGVFWSNYDVNQRTGEFLMLASDEPAQPPLTIAIDSVRAPGS